MLEVDFQGPFCLLPRENSPTVFACETARSSGIFLWTFEHKQAHRVHYVGAAEQSIAATNLSLMSQILLGERAIYNQQKLDEGELEILSRASSTSAEKCAATDAAFEQISKINLFIAPTCNSTATDVRIANAILQKLLNFGDIPTAWLEHGLRDNAAETEKSGDTVRFRRPAFIASLPDEMYL